MAAAGVPITNVIQILPTFLVVVGIGDSVHILTIFYRNLRETSDKRQAIVDAVGFAGLPALIALFPVKPHRQTTAGKPTLIEWIFDMITRLTTRRPLAVSLVSTVIIVAAGYSAFAVQFALAADFLLIPALLSLVYGRRKGVRGPMGLSGKF